MINTPQKNLCCGNETFFDFDYAVIETGQTGSLYTSTVLHNSTAFVYSNNWFDNEHDGVLESVTSTSGGAATFSFTGSSVAIYGSVDANHGNYTVLLDSETNSMNLNGTYFDFVPNQMRECSKHSLRPN